MRSKFHDSADCFDGNGRLISNQKIQPQHEFQYVAVQTLDKDESTWHMCYRSLWSYVKDGLSKDW